MTKTDSLSVVFALPNWSDAATELVAAQFLSQADAFLSRYPWTDVYLERRAYRLPMPSVERCSMILALWENALTVLATLNSHHKALGWSENDTVPALAFRKVVTKTVILSMATHPHFFDEVVYPWLQLASRKKDPNVPISIWNEFPPLVLLFQSIMHRASGCGSVEMSLFRIWVREYWMKQWEVTIKHHERKWDWNKFGYESKIREEAVMDDRMKKIENILAPLFTLEKDGPVVSMDILHSREHDGISSSKSKSQSKRR